MVWTQRGEVRGDGNALGEHHAYVAVTSHREGAGLRDTLFRVDLRNGQTRSREFGAGSVEIISPDPLLVRLEQGELLSLDAELETLWSYSQDPTSQFVGIRGGLVFLTYPGREPYTSAVDASTGMERLRFDAELDRRAVLAAMPGSDFIAFPSADTSALLFFDQTTGEATGQVSIADVVGRATVAGPHFVAGLRDRIVAFDRTGTEQWSRESTASVVSGPGDAEQVIVIEGRNVIALSADDGSPRWGYRSPEPVSAERSWVDGDYVWLAAENGDQLLFGDTGQPGLQCHDCVRIGSDFFRHDGEGDGVRVTRLSEGGVEVWRSELVSNVNPDRPLVFNRDAVALCGDDSQVSLLDRADGHLLETIDLPTEYAYGEPNPDICWADATEHAFLVITDGGATVIAFDSSE